MFKSNTLNLIAILTIFASLSAPLFAHSAKSCHLLLVHNSNEQKPSTYRETDLNAWIKSLGADKRYSGPINQLDQKWQEWNRNSPFTRFIFAQRELKKFEIFGETAEKLKSELDKVSENNLVDLTKSFKEKLGLSDQIAFADKDVSNFISQVTIFAVTEIASTANEKLKPPLVPDNELEKLQLSSVAQRDFYSRLVDGAKSVGLTLRAEYGDRKRKAYRAATNGHAGVFYKGSDEELEFAFFIPSIHSLGGWINLANQSSPAMLDQLRRDVQFYLPMNLRNQPEIPTQNVLWMSEMSGLEQLHSIFANSRKELKQFVLNYNDGLKLLKEKLYFIFLDMKLKDENAFKQFVIDTNWNPSNFDSRVSYLFAAIGFGEDPLSLRIPGPIGADSYERSQNKPLAPIKTHRRIPFEIQQSGQKDIDLLVPPEFR